MSRLTLSKAAAPSAPAAGKVSIYFNSASGRYELIDGDTGQTYPLQAAEFDKNLLVNAGFDLAQRQAPGTLTSYATSANRQYGADRWAMMVQTSSLQFQRVDTIGATESGITARMYGKYKQITGAGKAIVLQWVESTSTAPLRGRKVRVQVKMKRTVASSMTIRLGLVQNQAAGTFDAPTAAFVSAYGSNGVDPTLGASIAAIAPVANTAIGGSISGNYVTCVLSGSWVNYGAVFTAPSDCKNLAVVIITDSQLAINDELNVTEAGLFDGPDVVDWLPQPFANEVDRCQRFYCKSFAIDSAPAQNFGQGGAVEAIAGKAGATALGGQIGVRFPVRMRATPTTITIYCPTEASAQIDRLNGTTPIAHTATATQDSNDCGFAATSTGTANTAVGDLIGLHYSAEAEI